MPPLDDVARFAPEDPTDLVAASFSCPCCLRGDTDVAIERGEAEADARCGCRCCGARWTVALDAQQVVRLALHPPPPTGLAWRLRLRFRDAVA